MSLVIEASFQDGAFKPAEPIPYLSGQRVKLTIDLLPQETAKGSLNKANGCNRQARNW